MKRRRLLLKVALDHAEVQYADTSALTAAIDAVNALNPSDYKDFTHAASCRDAGLILLHERPTIDRQDEVDYWTQTIQDGIARLVWKEGTLNNPIKYEYMMDVTAGLYYNYRNKNWLCLKSKSPCLILPGTSSEVWEIA